MVEIGQVGEVGEGVQLRVRALMSLVVCHRQDCSEQGVVVYVWLFSGGKGGRDGGGAMPKMGEGITVGLGVQKVKRVWRLWDKMMVGQEPSD